MEQFAIPTSSVKGSLIDFGLLKKIIRLAAPFKKEFIAATVLALFLAALAPLRPWLIKITVDNYILNYDYEGLMLMSLLLIGQLLVESGTQYHFRYLTSWLGQSVIKNLRVRVFNHVIRLRLRFFDRTPIGTITTRTINDVEAVNDIFSEGLITIIADLLTILAIIAVMLAEDWRLTLVSLSTFPLLLYATYIFKERIKSSFNKVRNQVAQLNAFLQEHISGMRIIQIFTAEKQEMEKFKVINARHRDANIESIWYFSIFFPLVEVVLASALGLMVWYGAVRVMQSQGVIAEGPTIGTLVSFIFYLNMLFRPLRVLADKFNTLQMGMVAGERVFALLERKEQIENTGSLKADTIRGDIAFRNVWFAYVDELFVLKNISFSLPAGKTLAIVGATGSGKTSIINTLNRFYEIQKGSICVDEHDIRDYDVYSLRSQIGMVLQDVFLFSGSIMENITLRNEQISQEEVIRAAQLVGAHDFIMKLPGQYDYNVQERGATLSMGQRQLISFVRALVFNPRILILDEATSSIDTESEQLIQQAIAKLVKGRTSIVIAHRLSTIENADLILVLDDGQVKEMGTHQELLGKEGYYKRLHQMQFSSRKPATPA
ncbi:MAG: xenobiotic ABC transporter ATP-binding protein [Chitinophagales bacterium]|nr:MAG: xenobiotic ABC transporter ATP-binding protein [Chitinophagales bacterium]